MTHILTPNPTPSLYRGLTLRALLCVTLLLVSSLACAEENWYVRLSAGNTSLLNDHFRDADCTQTTPAALFGCGTGSDGRALGAYGSFSSARLMETAIGFQFKENFRVEVLVSGQETSDFTGQANFTGVIGAQPVSASLSQQSILFALYRDIDSIPSLRSAGLVPYLGLGAGLTRHELSSVSFLFPGLTQPSWSLTPDGTHHAMTLMVTAGLNYSLSEHLSIDFSYRYQDSGKARTSAGMMTNQRGGAPFTIGIDSIYTRVRAQQIMAGLRYQF